MDNQMPSPHRPGSGSTAGLRKLSLVLLMAALIPYVATCKDDRNVTDPLDPELPVDSQWVVATAAYPGGTLQMLTGFAGPYGIAFAPDGSLFVPDLFEGRVVRFTSDLRYNGWLGKIVGVEGSESGWHTDGLPDRGTEVGMFNMAHSVDFDRQGDIFVADYMNSRIHRYSPDGFFMGLFFASPSPAELAFAGCANAAFDAQYNLWVADFDGHRIYKFGPEGSLIGWIGERDNGQLTDGFATTGVAQQSTRLGGFFKPHMVRIDADGNILVVETGNNRVQKLTPEGLPIGWFGALNDSTLTDGWIDTGFSQPASLPGGFINPVSLRLLENDTMLIADNGNHRIQKFSADGRFAVWIGGKSTGGVTSGWEADGRVAEGTEPGMFSAPFDALVHNGRLFVADGHNGRVQIFDLD